MRQGRVFAKLKMHNKRCKLQSYRILDNQQNPHLANLYNSKPTNRKTTFHNQSPKNTNKNLAKLASLWQKTLQLIAIIKCILKSQKVKYLRWILHRERCNSILRGVLIIRVVALCHLHRGRSKFLRILKKKEVLKKLLNIWDMIWMLSQLCSCKINYAIATCGKKICLQKC